MHPYCDCMMTNVTFALPDKTVRRLRKAVKESGGKKGAISQFVDQAITYYLDAADERAVPETWVAKGGDDVVLAESDSLESLAQMLKAKGVDWRKALITTRSPPEELIHLGLRMRQP